MVDLGGAFQRQRLRDVQRHVAVRQRQAADPCCGQQADLSRRESCDVRPVSDTVTVVPTKGATVRLATFQRDRLRAGELDRCVVRNEATPRRICRR